MCELALARRETAQVISTAETELERQFEAGARVYRADLLLLKANALLQERDLLRGKETLEQARAEAEAIGSRRMLWRILNALSGVEKELGNQASADALQRQAQELAQFIADSAPPDLRARFLSLPDVRALEVN
jgi:hypothetical protein